MFNLGLDLKHPWETEPKVLDKHDRHDMIKLPCNTSQVRQTNTRELVFPN